MVHLKLIELVDSRFNSKIDFLGFKNFLNPVESSLLTNESIAQNKEKLSVSYYCFNVPEELKEKFSLNEKIISEDLIFSEVYECFSKKLFYEMDKVYPSCFKDYNDIKEKTEIISKMFDNYVDSSGKINGERILEDGKTISLDSELNSFPFYSSFYKEYRLNQARFLFSDFKINYSSNVKELVDMFRNEFNGKDFDYKGFNRVIFEKYGFFKV